MRELERGPYPNEHGFWRWQSGRPIFRRQFDDAMSVIVNFLPGASENEKWGQSGGWGYLILTAGVVVNAQYDTEWSSEDAMRAAIAKLKKVNNGNTD